MISKRIPKGDWEGVLSIVRWRTSEEKEIVRDDPGVVSAVRGQQGFQPKRGIVDAGGTTFLNCRLRVSQESNLVSHDVNVYLNEREWNLIEMRVHRMWQE